MATRAAFAADLSVAVIGARIVKQSGGRGHSDLAEGEFRIVSRFKTIELRKQLLFYKNVVVATTIPVYSSVSSLVPTLSRILARYVVISPFPLMLSFPQHLKSKIFVMLPTAWCMSDDTCMRPGTPFDSILLAV